MIIRWAQKKFPDGSIIRACSKESWIYVDPDGHSIEVQIYYAGKDIYPERIIDSRNLIIWDSPGGEAISVPKRAEIIEKFRQYFGAEKVRVE